jgi:RNA recognition motif-containing protein
VIDITVITDPRTKTHRGFCFVTMATVEQANAAIDKFNGTTLDGSKLIVEKVRVSLHVVGCLFNWLVYIQMSLCLIASPLCKQNAIHSVNNLQTSHHNQLFNIQQHPLQINWITNLQQQAKRAKPRNKTPGRYLGSRPSRGPGYGIH